MSRNTSEDNASFAEILEETQQKHREKHAWLYENESSRKQVGCHFFHLNINYALDLNTFKSIDKMPFLCFVYSITGNYNLYIHFNNTESKYLVEYSANNLSLLFS